MLKKERLFVVKCREDGKLLATRYISAFRIEDVFFTLQEELGPIDLDVYVAKEEDIKRYKELCRKYEMAHDVLP